MQRVLLRPLVLVPLLAACRMETEGTGSPETGSSSESSSSADTTSSDDGPDATTTAPGSSTSEGSSTEDDSGTSSADSESTGEPVIEDWALSFTGDGRLVSTSNIAWTATEYTVEAWLRIDSDDATGILIDGRDPALIEGWAWYIDPADQRLIFAFFDSDGDWHPTFGPDLDDIGLGWHHIAATHQGTTMFIHIDGTAVAAESVAASMSMNTGEIFIGDAANAEPAFKLRGVTIDDVRFSDSPRYSDAFDPDVEFVSDGSTFVFLPIDEGDGVVASDDSSEVVFSIEGADWVPGNTER